MPTRNIKRTYIGGTKSEARKKYLNWDKDLTQITTNLATSYGISPSLVIDRLAHEGLIDRLIKDNNKWVLSGEDPNYPSDAFDMDDYNQPFGLLGLDNIFDTYTKGITKTKRPINIIKQVNRNEKGELVNSAETKNLYDTLELFVAELASRRNQVKKQYPNLNDEELDSATSARYNASNKYFKQLMDSGEYKTKYPIDVEGVNIPTPTKTDSKYIQNQSKEINLDETFTEMPYEEYIYDNKTWNPNLFLEDDKVVNPNNKIVKGILEGYVKRNFTHPDKVKVVQEYKYGGRRKARFGLEENNVPTQEEYIAQQIAAKRAAALDKSRNRTSVRVPMIPNQISEDTWRKLKMFDYDYTQNSIDKAIREQRYDDAKALRDLLEKIESEYLNLTGYSKTIPGANCIYNAGDCYGLNIPGNQTFAAKHKELGFKRVNSSNMEPGDIVQDNRTGTPIHAMIYDSKDTEGNLRFNYARGTSIGNINADYVRQGKYPLPLEDYTTYRFVGTPADSTQWINEYKQKYGNGMRCGGRRKAQLGLDIREGGIAQPIANNMWYIHGRKHEDGGVTMGPNNKNGVEVEGGEVVEMIDSKHPSVGRQFKAGGQQQTMRVFSSVPFLRGASPAELVIGGANPDVVFKAQEEFKDRNRINDDGSTYEMGGEGKAKSKRSRPVTGVLPYGYTIRNLYAVENPYRKGIKGNVAKMYDSRTLGAGVDVVSGHPELYKKAKSGKMTKKQADETAVIHLRKDDNAIRSNYADVYGKAAADTLSYGPRFLVAQARYQQGNVRKAWQPIHKAMAKGDAKALKKAVLQVTPKDHDYRRKWIEDFKVYKMGGMIYEINGNVKNGLMASRPKAQYGTRKKFVNGGNEEAKEKIINATTKIGKDGLIYTKSIDGDWHTDGTRYEDSKYYMGRRSAQSYSREKIKPKTEPTSLDEVVVTAEAPKQYDYDIDGDIYFRKNGQKVYLQDGYRNYINAINDKESAKRLLGREIPFRFNSKKGKFEIYNINADKWVFTDYNLNKYIKTTEIEGVQANYPDNKSDKSNYKSFTYKKDKDGKFVKVYTDTKTDNAYVRPNREGANYKPSSYNPLTGEKVNNDGIVETPEPSIKGTTKVSAQATSTPRKGGTQSTATSRGTAKVESPKPATATNPNEARYASTIKPVKKIEAIAGDKKRNQRIKAAQIVDRYRHKAGANRQYDDNSPDKYRYTRAAGFKNEVNKVDEVDKANETKTSTTGGRTQSKDGRWIGQYKTTNVGDWIGLGSNLAGSVASYFMTKNAINKMPEPIKPVMAQAAKLKTKYNVEPQLTGVREAEQMNRAAVRRNTQSSNTSLAREQRLMNEARGARNTLYGQKENIETQLINKDKLNRQAVMMENVNKYNDYLNRLIGTRQAKNQLKISNINNLLTGLTGSVNNILGTIESRRTTNNTLRAIAAANPNVDARQIGGFDNYIGIGPDGKPIALYDKHQKLVRYI